MSRHIVPIYSSFFKRSETWKYAQNLIILQHYTARSGARVFVGCLQLFVVFVKKLVKKQLVMFMVIHDLTLCYIIWKIWRIHKKVFWFFFIDNVSMILGFSQKNHKTLCWKVLAKMMNNKLEHIINDLFCCHIDLQQILSSVKY